FAWVFGGGLRPGWAADALAASANGSRIAVGAFYYHSHVNPGPEQSDQVVVINTRTGAQRTWRGGAPAGRDNLFPVASPSRARHPQPALLRPLGPAVRPHPRRAGRP